MWEDVKSDGNGPNVRRLAVPGGWLYGTYYAKTEHYVFVPAPAQPEFPTEYNRGFCDGFHGHEPQPLGDKVGAPGDYKDYKHNTQYIYDATTQTFDLAAVQEPVCDRCEGELYDGREGVYPKYLVGCVDEVAHPYTDYVPATHGLFATRPEAEAYLATVAVGCYPFIVQLDKPLYDRKVTKGVKVKAGYDEVIKLIKGAAAELDQFGTLPGLVEHLHAAARRVVEMANNG